MESGENPQPILFPLIALHGLMHIMANTLPALSPLVKAEFQLTHTAVGVLSFLFAAAIGLGSIPSGLLSDRFGGARLISLCFFATTIFSGLLFFSHEVFSLSLIFICMGFFLSLYHPSALNYISNSFRFKRGKIFGVHEVGASIGFAVTPIVAGLICHYTAWRFVYLFWVFPIVFFVFLLLRMMSTDDPTVDDDAPNVNVFLRQLLKTKTTRRIYVLECLFGFVVGGAVTFLPIFLNEAKGLDPAFAVMTACVFTGGGAIGKIAGGHFSDIVGARRVMAFGFFIVAPLFLVVPFIPLFWSILALALVGLIFPAVLPAIITTISNEIEPSRTGFAFGLLMFVGYGFGAIASILLGLVSDSFGISTVFYPIVIATLVGGFMNICIPGRGCAD